MDGARLGHVAERQRRDGARDNGREELKVPQPVVVVPVTCCCCAPRVLVQCSSGVAWRGMPRHLGELRRDGAGECGAVELEVDHLRGDHRKLE